MVRREKVSNEKMYFAVYTFTIQVITSQLTFIIIQNRVYSKLYTLGGTLSHTLHKVSIKFNVNRSRVNTLACISRKKRVFINSQIRNLSFMKH
jgi:hypothetical protein